MKYKVLDGALYELIDGAYVFIKEFDDKLEDAQALFNSLETGQLEKITDIGSEIIESK